jgi:hypothetical protein
MPETTPQRHAFVVRIWQEEGLHWRGWIQHAGSQEQTYIQSVPEIVDFIQHHTQGLVGLGKEDTGSSTAGNARQERTAALQR